MSGKIQPLSDIRKMSEVEGKKSPASREEKEYNEGRRFLENGELGQAAVALHNALLAFEEKGNTDGIANASNQLGHLCVAREEFDGALKHYQRAWEICSEAGDEMSVMAVLDRRINAWLGLGKFDMALKDCHDILSYNQDLRNPQGVVVAMERMGDIYLQAGDNEKAADAFRSIASIHRGFKHSNYAAKFEKRAEDALTGAGR